MCRSSALNEVVNASLVPSHLDIRQFIFINMLYISIDLYMEGLAFILLWQNC